MSTKELRPLSVDLVKNVLAHSLKDGVSEGHKKLHSDALKRIAALDEELEALRAAVADLEAEYAREDAIFRDQREKRVKYHGGDSYYVKVTDTYQEGRRSARFQPHEVGADIAAEMDTTFRNFLDGKVTGDELKNAVSLAAGFFAVADPLTLMFQLFEQINKAIDRLENERVKSDQYNQKVELFSKIVDGFGKLFHALRTRTKSELDLHS